MMKDKAGRQKQSRKRRENGRKAARGNRLPRASRKAENGQKRTADRQAGNDQSGQAVTDHHRRKPPELCQRSGRRQKQKHPQRREQNAKWGNPHGQAAKRHTERIARKQKTIPARHKSHENGAQNGSCADARNNSRTAGKVKSGGKWKRARLTVTILCKQPLSPQDGRKKFFSEQIYTPKHFLWIFP